MRIALGIEYDGSGYCGWQFQNGQASVQECLEKSLSRVADRPVRVICAGRTDTGVHALGQVVHFNTDAERDDSAWLRGTNVYLPDDISVTWAKTISEDFHARFSATGRAYRYVILNRRQRSAILHGRVTWEYRPLDVERMREAAGALLGEHDFTAYRAVACQAKNPVRTLRQLDIRRQGEIVTMDVEADAFLHHMVRNFAGVLMSIGAGEKAPTWAGEVLRSRDRTCGGVTALPDGLYMTAVSYPDEFGLPQLSPLPVVW